MKKLLILVFIILAACQTRYPDFGVPNQKAIDVSLVNLIATPDIYHEKIVRVIGVFRLRFEGNALFLSQDDYKHNIHKNSIWISPDLKALKSDLSTLQQLNGQYVLIEGTFDKNKTEHMGLNSGSLQKVTRIMLINH